MNSSKDEVLSRSPDNKKVESLVPSSSSSSSSSKTTKDLMGQCDANNNDQSKAIGDKEKEPHLISKSSHSTSSSPSDNQEKSSEQVEPEKTDDKHKKVESKSQDDSCKGNPSSLETTEDSIDKQEVNAAKNNDDLKNEVPKDELPPEQNLCESEKISVKTGQSDFLEAILQNDKSDDKVSLDLIRCEETIEDLIECDDVVQDNDLKNEFGTKQMKCKSDKQEEEAKTSDLQEPIPQSEVIENKLSLNRSKCQTENEENTAVADQKEGALKNNHHKDEVSVIQSGNEPKKQENENVISDLQDNNIGGKQVEDKSSLVQSIICERGTKSKIVVSDEKKGVIKSDHPEAKSSTGQIGNETEKQEMKTAISDLHELPLKSEEIEEKVPVEQSIGETGKKNIIATPDRKEGALNNNHRKDELSTGQHAFITRKEEDESMTSRSSKSTYKSEEKGEKKTQEQSTYETGNKSMIAVTDRNEGLIKKDNPMTGLSSKQSGSEAGKQENITVASEYPEKSEKTKCNIRLESEPQAKVKSTPEQIISESQKVGETENSGNMNKEIRKNEHEDKEQIRCKTQKQQGKPTISKIPQSIPKNETYDDFQCTVDSVGEITEVTDESKLKHPVQTESLNPPHINNTMGANYHEDSKSERCNTPSSTNNNDTNMTISSIETEFCNHAEIVIKSKEEVKTRLSQKNKIDKRIILDKKDRDDAETDSKENNAMISQHIKKSEPILIANGSIDSSHSTDNLSDSSRGRNSNHEIKDLSREKMFSQPIPNKFEKDSLKHGPTQIVSEQKSNICFNIQKSSSSNGDDAQTDSKERNSSKSQHANITETDLDCMSEKDQKSIESHLTLSRKNDESKSGLSINTSQKYPQKPNCVIQNESESTKTSVKVNETNESQSEPLRQSATDKTKQFPIVDDTETDSKEKKSSLSLHLLDGNTKERKITVDKIIKMPKSNSSSPESQHPEVDPSTKQCNESDNKGLLTCNKSTNRIETDSTHESLNIKSRKDTEILIKKNEHTLSKSNLIKPEFNQDHESCDNKIHHNELVGGGHFKKNDQTIYGNKSNGQETGLHDSNECHSQRFHESKVIEISRKCKAFETSEKDHILKIPNQISANCIEDKIMEQSFASNAESYSESLNLRKSIPLKYISDSKKSTILLKHPDIDNKFSKSAAETISKSDIDVGEKLNCNSSDSVGFSKKTSKNSTTQNMSRDHSENTEDIKLALYLEGTKIHRGKGAERLFSDYWDALGRYISVEVGRHIRRSRCGDTYSNASLEPLLKTYLKTRKLRKLHNKLILSIMTRCYKDKISKSMFGPHVPHQWSRKVKQQVKRKQAPVEDSQIKPKITKRNDLDCSQQNERRCNDIKFDLENSKRNMKLFEHHFDRKSWMWTVLGNSTITSHACLESSGIRQNPIMKQQNGNYEIENNFPSLNLPGSLSVDLQARRLSQKKGLKVSDAAISLITIAVREYSKNILSHTVSVMNELSKSHLPALQNFSIERTKFQLDPCIAEQKMKRDHISVCEYDFGSKKRQRISSTDIAHAISSHTSFYGLSEKSSSFTRQSWRRFAYDGVRSTSYPTTKTSSLINKLNDEKKNENIMNDINSRLNQDLGSQGKSLNTNASEANKQKDNVSPTVQRPPSSQGLGRGAKNLSRMLQRANSSSIRPSSASNSSPPPPIPTNTTQNDGNRVKESQNDNNPDSKQSDSRGTTDSVGRSNTISGRGIGVKNLAVLKKRPVSSGGTASPAVEDMPGTDVTKSNEIKTSPVNNTSEMKSTDEVEKSNAKQSTKVVLPGRGLGGKQLRMLRQAEEKRKLEGPK